ncbi:MAG: Plug domain-containing protein, partial [Bacteroidota bacterium]
GQTHTPTGFSNNAKVALVNGQDQLVEELRLHAPDGYAQGTIDLPVDLSPGAYQLIAYTDYQRNAADAFLFRKTINLVPGIAQDIAQSTNYPTQINASNNPSQTQANQIQLRFFPEGGDCINGLPCKVAVAANDRSGNPVQLKGELYGSGASMSIAFETNEYGNGTFTYTPESADYYEIRLADVNESVRYGLPPIQDDGYTLQVVQQADDFELTIRTNRNSLQGSKLLVHRRGIAHLLDAISLDQPIAKYNLLKEDLVPGVYVATVFDSNNMPIAERLFFRSPDAATTSVDLTIGAKPLSTRMPVDLTLNIPSSTAPSSTGQLSVSILPIEASVNTKQDDIRSWLLLNSDLDELIPNAQALLANELDKNTNDDYIEQFLLTRGWRRFSWETLSNLDGFEPKFPLEQGIMLKGQMQIQDPPYKVQPGKVFLTQLNGNVFEEQLTDENGEFAFGPFIFKDQIELIVQGRYQTKRKRRLAKEITLDDLAFVRFQYADDPQPPLFQKIGNKDTKILDKVYEGYQAISQDMLSIARNYDAQIYDIDAVEITGKRISRIERMQQEIRRGFSIAGGATRTILLDSMPGARNFRNVQDLLGVIAGININGGVPVLLGNGPFLGNNNGPLLLLDGIQVDWTFMRNMNPIELSMIDISRGPDASIYGGRGSRGVIHFYTARGKFNTFNRSPGIQNILLEGFHKAREFAVFDPLQTGYQNRADIRTTLHWNPAIKLDKFGVARESFTTSDQRGQFMIIAQGLREDGTPLFGSAVFEVQ